MRKKKSCRMFHVKHFGAAICGRRGIGWDVSRETNFGAKRGSRDENFDRKAAQAARRVRGSTGRGDGEGRRMHVSGAVAIHLAGGAGDYGAAARQRFVSDRRAFAETAPIARFRTGGYAEADPFRRARQMHGAQLDHRGAEGRAERVSRRGAERIIRLHGARVQHDRVAQAQRPVGGRCGEERRKHGYGKPREGQARRYCADLRGLRAADGGRIGRRGGYIAGDVRAVRGLRRVQGAECVRIRF